MDQRFYFLCLVFSLDKNPPAVRSENVLVKQTKKFKKNIYITDFDKISFKTLFFCMFRGTWGPRQFCASGSFATGFVLRYAPLCASRCNFDDDTALMGIW